MSTDSFYNTHNLPAWLLGVLIASLLAIGMSCESSQNELLEFVVFYLSGHCDAPVRKGKYQASVLVWVLCVRKRG
jgi:hypothetical protein